MKVLKDNKDKFGINFDENKEVLNSISIIRSKILKNELAGYITKLIRNELRDKAEKTKSVSNEEEPVIESESKETIAPERPQVSGDKDSAKDTPNTNELED